MADNLEIMLDINLISAIADVSLLYEKCPNYDPDEGSNVDVILSLNDIKERDLKIDGHNKSIYHYFSEFLGSVLGDNVEKVANNILTLKYKNEVLEYVSRPTIALVNDEPCLILGAKTDDSDTLKIPLIVGEKGITLEGSLINRLTLSSLEVQKSDNTKIKLPIACFNVNKTVYAIPIALSSDSTFYDLQVAWDDRDLDALKESISYPYGGNANLGTMFTELFDSGLFPSNGVIIPLTGFTKQQKTLKTGGKFWTVSFTVDTKSIYPVNVLAYYDGSVQPISIKDVTKVSTVQDPKEPLGTLPFTDRGEKNPPTPQNPWYVHIKGKNPRKKAPFHVLFTGELPAKQKRILEEQSLPTYFTF